MHAVPFTIVGIEWMGGFYLLFVSERRTDMTSVLFSALAFVFNHLKSFSVTQIYICLMTVSIGLGNLDQNYYTNIRD